MSYWAKTYGPGEAKAVAVDKNGDIIVAGYVTKYGSKDGFVARLNEEGNVKWFKVYVGEKRNVFNDVKIAPTGDIIVAGYTKSFGAGKWDVWVLRLDENGNVKWQKTYGGSNNDGYWNVNVTVVPNGDIIVAGDTESFGAGEEDIWILRLDFDGNIKWQKTYGGSSTDWVWGVVVAPNEDIIVAGSTKSFGTGDWNAWVLRLDKRGNIIWQKTYGGSDWDGINAIAISSNGDIIVAGESRSFGTGGKNIWVLRLPPDGNLPSCDFCRDSNAQVMDTNAEVHNTHCEVLSGVRKYQVEVGLIRKRKEWRTEKVSLVVMDSKAIVKSLNVTPKVQYYLDPEPLKQNICNSITLSIPQLIEGADSIIKLTAKNDFTNSLKLTLDLSSNDFLEFETTTLEFPELKKGQKITKTIAVTPKYAGTFDFRVKIKAIADGIELETEKTIPVEVVERTATPITPMPQPATPSTPATPVTPASSHSYPTITTFPAELLSIYEPIEELGRGGFARVYKAKRKRDGEIVAVKIPLSLDPVTGKSFLREIENWTKLKHPNIVRVYDYNILPIPFFEMEYCESSLEKLPKPMDVRSAALLVFNIAEGLKYAHSRGIIHRDLKPSNILLKNGIPKISDWGLSKVVGKSGTTTTSFTALYAAPEQFSKSRFGKTDERTDIYQLGVIFYQLITGRLPFESDDPFELMFMIMNEEPVKPSEFNPEAKEIELIILRMLAKHKEDRYESAAELQSDLASYLGIEFRRELKRSRTMGDKRLIVYYLGNLLIMSVKMGNLTGAYKYASDFIELTSGELKQEFEMLAEQFKFRLEEGLDIPVELIEKTDILVHKVMVRIR